MHNEEEKNKQETLKNATIVGAQFETVQRYGSAVKQHHVAYSGVDNETGKQLQKSLRGISNLKVHPKYKDSNIKQQAGFSAEVKTVARENAQKIIDGENSSHITRTDDMIKQSDGRGNTVGGKNEQLYDIAEIDSNGSYIEGSARQLKYVGRNAELCTEKLLNKDFDKYRDADVPIEVPSDFYDDVIKKLTEKSEDVKKNIERAEKNGNIELANKHKARLEKIEKTKSNLRKGKLTNKEAIEARIHPKLSTVKDIHKISHKAGIGGAKISAAVGGGISAIQNTVAVIKGDKRASEAVADVVIDTTKSTAMGYATSYVGAAVKGAMQNAPNEYLQVLSKTNLPATMVVSAIEIGKTLTKLASGEIDGTECLIELGEKGTGMLAASAGAAVGQTFIPIPVIGGLIGGMVGYALSSAYYNSLVSTLKNAKLAREERIQIEAECAESIKAIKEYRLQIELVINNYMRDNLSVFYTAFTEMETAYNTENINEFISGVNIIVEQLGGDSLFNTQQELDELMNSEEKIKI